MSADEKLPNSNDAWVEEKKIRQYLLNSSHVDGASKAKFFKARGFSDSSWQTMQTALVTQGVTNRVIKTVDNEFGKRYTVECTIPTPDTSNPCIRSVWEIKPEDGRPRLLTAHPLN